MKTYEMNLNDGPFALIKSGRKNVEMRLNDEKRSAIQAGDNIIFTNTKTQEILEVQVTKIVKYPTFAALYQAFDKSALGYLDEEKANPKDMEQYYSPDKIKKYGVLAILVKLPSTSFSSKNI